MKSQTSLVYSVHPTTYSETIVKLYKTCQFTTVPKLVGNNVYTFHIKDVKGDFEIQEITADSGTVPFNEKTMIFGPVRGYSSFNFKILTNVEFKNVKTAAYHLFIPRDRLKYLDEFDYFEETIELPEIKGLTFACLIKKLQKNDIEVVIKNPYGAKIEGKKGDFVYKTTNYEIDKSLSFIVESAILEAVNPTESQVNKLSDAIIISSDGTEIPCQQSILTKYSPIFARIIEESKEIPVKINVDKFSSSIISEALHFCQGHQNAVNAKKEMLEFADEFNILELKEACCKSFIENANFENVIVFIEIAYLYKFERLKQKCMQILEENKEKIEPSKFEKLPNEILVDLFVQFCHGNQNAVDEKKEMN